MITFIDKDQNWQNETTNYWFNVDGETYAVSDNNGTLKLLDCDGCPVEPCNDHDNILEQLITLYEQYINE